MILFSLRQGMNGNLCQNAPLTGCNVYALNDMILPITKCDGQQKFERKKVAFMIQRFLHLKSKLYKNWCLDNLVESNKTN